MIRYGRFDIQVKMEYLEYDKALEIMNIFGYGEKELEEMNIKFPLSPSELQSKIMEYKIKNE